MKTTLEEKLRLVKLHIDGNVPIFDILSKILDLIEEYKHPVIFKELLKVFHVSISQYEIGINCVISNQDIIIENEYLISVANNSFNIIQLLNSLLDTIKKLELLNENQINEEIQLTKIMNSINKLTYNALVRLVYIHKDELGKDFEKINFFQIDTEKIILKTGEIFGKFRPMMNAPVVKKCWNEILKLTLCYYITSLLLTAKKSKKSIEEIKLKIKNDKKNLFGSYSATVGENLTNATLKILDDILDFLEVSQCMVSTSCLAIRQYIGPAFAYSAAKKLIKLRTDFSKKEKNDCKKQCEEVLNNCNSQKNEDSSYFYILREKIKKNDKDKRLSKRLSKGKYGNQILGKDDIENNNSSSDSDIDDEEENNIALEEKKGNVKETNLSTFLRDSDDENEKEDKNDENEINEEIKDEELYEDEEEEGEIIDDIEEGIEADYEGFLRKKSNHSYKKYFFQVKNGCLYWFKNKNIKIAKNKLSLKNLNQIDYSEEKKIILKINENGEIKKYKFKCEKEEEKLPWFQAISKASRKVQKENEIHIEQKIEIKPRKKIINDLFRIPNIKMNGIYIESKDLGSFLNEDFFKMSPEKIEKIRKQNKKIIDEEKKEKKEMKKLEKEEKKRIKKEEKEEKKRIKLEKSKEKKKEKDKSQEKKEKEKSKLKKSVGKKIKNIFGFSSKKKDKKNISQNEDEEV